MTFLSILCALLIEQFRPLRADNPIYLAVKSFSLQVESWFNAGEVEHGRIAWVVAVGTLVLPVIIISWLCAEISPLLSFVWNVFIVYLTLGFRHYSHYFTSIQFALNAGDDNAARALLSEWTKQDTAGLDTSEISRIAVETALITSHRNVFGVFFWFLLPLGPAGAVLYRVSEYLSRAWTEPEHLRNDEFGRFAHRAFHWIDWIPARLTAAAFAVVGNFEDAIYAWRNFAGHWQHEATGIILAAGGGAMGVRLGTPLETAMVVPPHDGTTIDPIALEADVLPGITPNVRSLQSTVGLVWRALLLWMLLLLLLSIAVWLG